MNELIKVKTELAKERDTQALQIQVLSNELTTFMGKIGNLDRDITDASVEIARLKEVRGAIFEGCSTSALLLSGAARSLPSVPAAAYRSKEVGGGEGRCKER